MARVEFPDAPITEQEWRKRRAIERIHGDLTKDPFQDDLASVADFMQTRESCDTCEATMDYDEERIIAIELTGERDNMWSVYCPACAGEHAQRTVMTLIYRVYPVHSLTPGITLIHNGVTV